MTWHRKAAVCALAMSAHALALAADAAPSPAPRLPAVDFVRPPELDRIRFSPDGKNFAALSERNGRMGLIVMDAATQKGSFLGAKRDSDIVSFRWITDDLIGLQTGRREGRISDMGSGMFESGYASITGRSRSAFFKGGRIVGKAPGGPDNVLVQYSESDLPSVRLEIMDASTGSVVRKVSPPAPGPRIRRWVIGRDFEVRAAVAWDERTRRTTAWVRDTKDAPWKVLTSFLSDSEAGFEPVAVDEQDRLLVLSNVGREHIALFALDPATGRPGELLAAHPKADIGLDDLIFTVGSRVPVGVEIEGDVPQMYWFDERRDAIQRSIDAALATSVNRLQFLPDGRVMVSAQSDRDPGTYFMYDPASKSLTEWGRTRPWIKPAQMAVQRPLRYKARDGVEIPAYLTLPSGPADTRRPLVVWVHGGPAARDRWGFDAEVQFLANRGYAVLQPNFRGSTGFSGRFELLGKKQWGQAMQDDVTDGVRWLIDQGVVDASRVCIGGTSYGGYAALMGVVREPSMFRCAIDIAGPTDLVRFVEIPHADYNWSPNATVDHWLKTYVGDPGDPKDRPMMEANSPLRRVADIKVPVLMIYGTDDTRVPLEHGSEMRDAMSRRGLPFVWKSYAGEGHGIFDRTNRIDYLTQIERFLDQHIGPSGGK